MCIGRTNFLRYKPLTTHHRHSHSSLFVRVIVSAFKVGSTYWVQQFNIGQDRNGRQQMPTKNSKVSVTAKQPIDWLMSWHRAPQRDSQARATYLPKVIWRKPRWRCQTGIVEINDLTTSSANPNFSIHIVTIAFTPSLHTTSIVVAWIN